MFLDFLFQIIPIGILLFFTMSLREFKETPKEHLDYKKIKKKFIVSAVLMGIISASVVGLFIIIFSLAHI
ncbi:MAG: hypothetical protein K2J39_08360 [Ruminococcus sp.]|nr:hypothetical protein [Ruminococcus sp.]